MKGITISGVIAGFLVFALFISVMFNSLGFMISDRGLNIALESEDAAIMEGFKELSEQTHQEFIDVGETVQKTSLGGEDSGSTQESALQGGTSTIGWSPIASISSVYPTVKTVFSTINTHFGKYIPNHLVGIIVSVIILTIALYLLSAILRNPIR